MTTNITLKVLVVDDEQIARRRIIRLLRALRDVEIIGEAVDVASAVAEAQRLEPDLMLLDIQMPGGDGFEVIDRLGSMSPAVVFITAFDQHALRAFETEAIDYVTKPVDPVRLAHAIERARMAILARSRQDQVAELLSTIANLRQSLGQSQALSRALWVKNRGIQHRIGIETIDYLQAERDYVRLFCGGQSHLVSDNLSTMEARLAPHGFIRIHRSSLVRRDAVSQILQDRHGSWSLRLMDGTDLKVGRTYAAGVKAALDLASAGRP